MKALRSSIGSRFEDNFFIKELGTRLSPDQRKAIKAKLHALEARAPAFSTINLTFLNINGKLKASLAVLSLPKNFRASRIGSDPVELFAELEKEMDRQIALWKETRFIHPLAAYKRESFKGTHL